MSLGEAFPAVLDAARGGAEWAWTSIYRELAPLVRGYLRSRGAAEPDDLTGEVFLQIARDLPHFSGGESELRSWALVIAHHRLLDARRSKARRPYDPASDEVILEKGPTGDVEEEAMGTLATESIYRLLQAATEDQREVLRLRIVVGLTVEEVARVVGKRPSTVKALQRRGLAAIKEKLATEVATL